MKKAIATLAVTAAICMPSAITAARESDQSALDVEKSGCAPAGSKLVPNSSVGGRTGQYCGLPADVALFPAPAKDKGAGPPVGRKPADQERPNDQGHEIPGPQASPPSSPHK